MAEVIRFDLEDLTVGETVEFEEIAGVPLSEFAPKDSGNGEVAVSAKALLAMVYISRKRSNPAFTLDDARDVKVSDLDFGSVGNPTTAARVRSSTKR